MTGAKTFGLNQKIIEAIRGVFSKHSEIEKVLVYGSRAKGNFKTGSDIDLTIIAKTLTTPDLLKIENELDDLMLAYKIDLSLHHQIENPDLFDHIQRVGLLFYQK